MCVSGFGCQSTFFFEGSSVCFLACVSNINTAQLSFTTFVYPPPGVKFLGMIGGIQKKTQTYIFGF